MNAPAAAADQPAATYDSYRPLLFSIAYRMTGSASEAEDIVQEGYLRFHGAVKGGSTAGEGELRSERSFLSTILARLSLDHLKKARVERERYVGPWLPEPVLTGAAGLPDQGALIRGAAPGADERYERREEVSLAFLVLLERLTPDERAVFLLSEVFDYPHDEIARMLEKTPAACRQLLRRARQRLEERETQRPRFRAAPDVHERLLARFLSACERGDMQALADLLAQDVVSTSDGGGKVHAARRPIVGKDAVARFVLGLLSKAPSDLRVQVVEVNGEPGLLTFAGGQLVNVVTFDAGDGAITGLRFVVNPDKLAYVRRQLREAEERVLSH